jgi:hypothetical protein
MKSKLKNEFCQNIFKMKKKREDFEKKVIGNLDIYLRDNSS